MAVDFGFGRGGGRLGARRQSLFPVSVIDCSVLLVVTARMGNGAWRFAAWMGALACALTWLDLAASGEAIMGFVAHPLFTVSAGFALIALLPLMSKKGAGFSALASAGLALLFAIIAGFLPAFSAASPERLNLRYVERDGHADWIADPVTKLPDALARAGHFSGIARFALFGRGYMRRCRHSRECGAGCHGERQRRPSDRHVAWLVPGRRHDADLSHAAHIAKRQ